MTTSFSIRDFFVYLIVGIICTLCLWAIFMDEVFNWTTTLFTEHDFIKEFSFLGVFFLIPFMYIFGQIIGSVNALIFFIYKKCQRKNSSKYSIGKILIYRQKVNYAIDNFKIDDVLKYSNSDKFWKACAKLQNEKIYSPAEYWYIMNELFGGLNLVFFISFSVALINCKLLLSIVFFLLTILSFIRAKQYAAHFVRTVYRLTDSKWPSYI
jgi:hypothetical protein